MLKVSQTIPIFYHQISICIICSCPRKDSAYYYNNFKLSYIIEQSIKSNFIEEYITNLVFCPWTEQNTHPKPLFSRTYIQNIVMLFLVWSPRSFKFLISQCNFKNSTSLNFICFPRNARQLVFILVRIAWRVRAWKFSDFLTSVAYGFQWHPSNSYSFHGIPLLSLLL